MNQAATIIFGFACFVAAQGSVELSIQLDIPDQCRDYYLGKDWTSGMITWQGRSFTQYKTCNMSISFERRSEADTSYMCLSFDHYSHRDCTWVLGFHCDQGMDRWMKCRHDQNYQDTSSWCCEEKSKIYLSLTTDGKDVLDSDNGFVLRVERSGYLYEDTVAYWKIIIGVGCSVAFCLITFLGFAMCCYRLKRKRQDSIAACGPGLGYTWNSTQPGEVFQIPNTPLPSYTEQSTNNDPPSYTEIFGDTSVNDDKDNSTPG